MKGVSRKSGKKDLENPAAGRTKVQYKSTDVINSLSDGVIGLDRDWRYTYLNDASLQMHPLGRKQTLGKSVWDVHPGMKDSILWDKYHDAMKTQKIVEVETYYAPMNTWFFVKVYPSGEGLTVLYMDITMRKRAEEEIMQGKRIQQTSLVAQLSDSIFISDESGNYVDVNPSACLLLGYSREELLMKNVKDILATPEAIAQTPERNQQLRAGISITSEKRLLRKEGTEIDVEENSMMMSDGKLVDIVRDITERKRSQQTLDKREKRFRAMVENSDDIIALLDPDNRPLYRSSSAERITGYSFDDSMQGISSKDIHPEDKDSLYAQLDKVRSMPGKPVVVEFRLKHKAGHFIWLEGTLTNLFDDPNVGALVINLRDVTTRKQAEEKLMVNERRFRALIENITDGIVLNDVNSNLLFQSASVERIMGYSWEERKGKAVLNFVHPDNREEFSNLYSKLKDNPGQPFGFQYRFLHKKGHYIWLEGVVTNLVQEPSVNAYVANYRDITERKIVEEKLKNERTLLRTMIDNLPDYIYVKDRSFRYLVNNKSQLNLMGFDSQKEALGKTAADIFGESFARPHHEEDDQLFRTGMSVLDREEIIFDKAGEPKFLLSTKVPLRDNQHKVIGLVGISRDITRQKKTELELRNSNYFLESAQRAGKIGYWISDILQNHKLIWSRETCNIFGMAPDQLNQHAESFYSAIHPDDREEVRAAAAAAIATKQPYSIDHRIILHDGSLKWVHEHGEVSVNENGVAYQLIGIVQDITERKDAEKEILLLNAKLEERVRIRTDQLETANKEMEAFTYSVSHDLRSPLRIIDGYAQILLEDYNTKLDETGQKTIEVITSNAKKMGKLIDDLLDFSRIGRAEINKVDVDMNELVAEVFSDLKLSGVSIPGDVNIKPMATAKCDANLVKLVWVNLISNAIKYSSAIAQPIIEIGAVKQNGTTVYSIKDNGAGFDMQYYHKLFGVFQRLHNHHEFSGTGVGLAIVHRIVVRHGGKVWAVAAVNAGATFFFSLE